MALEQTVKELQAQNAQFQETLLNLAQGKKEMVALNAKKKKTQNPVGVKSFAVQLLGPLSIVG